MTRRDHAAAAWLLEMVRLGEAGTVDGTEVAERVDQVLPLAHYEQVPEWLWHRLRKAGLFALLRPELQQEFRNQGLARAALNLRVVAVTNQVLSLLAGYGIRPVLVKGAAYCALADRYPFFGYRRTGDADLLFEPGTAARAWDLLHEHGFRPVTTEPSIHPDHHHLPGLVSDGSVTVEIHASASLFWSPEESWLRFGIGAEEITRDGQQLLVPGATELLWHSLAHSLGDGADGCRLRPLLTAAALLAAGTGIDWDVIAARIRRDPLVDHDSRHPLPPRARARWLAAAAWLARAELPPALVRGVRPGRDLVRLLDFRRRRLASWPQDPDRERRMARWMEEGARAQFGLGLGRAAHWDPPRARPKRLLSSLTYQGLYWALGA